MEINPSYQAFLQKISESDPSQLPDQLKLLQAKAKMIEALLSIAQQIEQVSLQEWQNDHLDGTQHNALQNRIQSASLLLQALSQHVDTKEWKEKLNQLNASAPSQADAYQLQNIESAVNGLLLMLLHNEALSQKLIETLLGETTFNNTAGLRQLGEQLFGQFIGIIKKQLSILQIQDPDNEVLLHNLKELEKLNKSSKNTTPKLKSIIHFLMQELQKNQLTQGLDPHALKELVSFFTHIQPMLEKIRALQDEKGSLLFQVVQEAVKQAALSSKTKEELQRAFQQLTSHKVNLDAFPPIKEEVSTLLTAIHQANRKHREICAPLMLRWQELLPSLNKESLEFAFDAKKLNQTLLHTKHALATALKETHSVSFDYVDTLANDIHLSPQDRELIKHELHLCFTPWNAHKHALQQLHDTLDAIKVISYPKPESATSCFTDAAGHVLKIADPLITSIPKLIITINASPSPQMLVGDAGIPNDPTTTGRVASPPRVMGSTGSDAVSSADLSSSRHSLTSGVLDSAHARTTGGNLSSTGHSLTSGSPSSSTSSSSKSQPTDVDHTSLSESFRRIILDEFMESENAYLFGLALNLQSNNLSLAIVNGILGCMPDFGSAQSVFNTATIAGAKQDDGNGNWNPAVAQAYEAEKALAKKLFDPKTGETAQAIQKIKDELRSIDHNMNTNPPQIDRNTAEGLKAKLNNQLDHLNQLQTKGSEFLELLNKGEFSMDSKGHWQLYLNGSKTSTAPGSKDANDAIQKLGQAESAMKTGDDSPESIYHNFTNYQSEYQNLGTQSQITLQMHVLEVGQIYGTITTAMQTLNQAITALCSAVFKG